jgi:hypothetical protein
MFIMKRLGIFLAIAFVGCGGVSSPSGDLPSSAQVNAPRPSRMSKYPYLAADGGPHLLLPAETAATWSGGATDYGRACAATAASQMALIPVGSDSAMAFADPPMTAWGKSADGLIEVYYLKSWTGMDLDSLIAKATAALPTASLADSGKTLRFGQPDAFLLFAGDTPNSVTYACHRVSVPAGTYKVLVGTYSTQGESVTVYRLQTAGR